MIERLIFLSPFKAEAIGKREWRLLAPLRAEYILGGDPARIEVPEGYVTDLASVPRLPGVFLFFGSRARRSAVLHDYLYGTDADRELADEVFIAAMRAEGEPWYVRWPMWLGVRVGGWAFRRKANR
jgi:hypothetical protein